MSDSDSSLSSAPRTVKKRPIASTTCNLDDSSDDEAFTFTKHSFSPRHKTPHSYAPSDSDSDDSLLNPLKVTKQKNSKKPKVFTSSILDDSDSDNDDLKISSSALSSKNFVEAKTKTPISLDSDSDDDEGIKVVESVVMKKARLAREALENEPVDLLDDDDNDDDEIHYDIPAAPVMTVRTTKKLTPDPPANGPLIRIQFRANITSSPANHVGKTLHGKSIVLKFRTGTKWEIVSRRYREQVDRTISSHATVTFVFDGLGVAMDKTIAQYDMDDEDMVDVSISIPANAAPATVTTMKTTSVSSSHQASVETKYVQIKTTIKGGDPQKFHTFQLSASDPFDKLLKTYRDMRGYSSFKRVLLETNNIRIDPTLCPNDLGFEGACAIVICDEQERVKQIQRMPNASTSSSTNQVAGSAGGLKIKIRINGSTKSFDAFSILPSEPFQKLMDWVCQKYYVKTADCKYIFDGAPLNPNYTPNDEDLEGDEVIDVEINKDSLEKGAKTAKSSIPLSAQPQNSEPASSQQLSIGSSRKLMVEGSLGVTICAIDGFIRVKTIDNEKMKGSLFPGDKITYANGKEVVGTTAPGFAKLLKSVGNRREFTVQFLGSKGAEEVFTKAPKALPRAVSTNTGTHPTKAVAAKGPSASSQITAKSRSNSDSCVKATVSVLVVRNNVSSAISLMFSQVPSAHFFFFKVTW
jgi:hypothetical protein